jgi:two-component system CheB/CheR fusion protein
LVVDDNQEVAEALILVLESFGHRAWAVNDGVSGLARARELHPDTMLCDVDLPDMSGYDLARALRAEDRLRGVLLISVSGYTRRQDRERAQAAGFDLHFSKPVDLELLERSLMADPIAARPYSSRRGQ